METVERAIGNRQWPSDGDESACRIVEALSDHAVYWVIERRYGECVDLPFTDDFSTRGQMHCNLYEILGFLTASLATEEPRLFNDYVHWRLDVLGFRSQQTSELATMLRLLAQFFAQRFGPISGVPLSRVLAGGIALADGAEAAPGREPYVPASLAQVEGMAEHLVRGDISAARMLARRAELDGWSVQFLGANVPSEALILYIDSWRPEVVCLSASLASQLLELRRLVVDLRDRFGQNQRRLWWGGRATNKLERVWESLGADEWFPDAERASAGRS